MGASVTFLEATAPVKLPTRHCPPVLLRLEPKTAKGGISTTAPLQLALEVHSLPPILHMTVPSPIPGYSKAPRGLFVLPRVARVFTGTAISPSPPPRQWPSRSTIHAGRNLPDKGLRYLRQFVTPPLPDSGRGVGRSFLPTSACRHADRTISSRTFRQRVRRMVSEDSEDSRNSSPGPAIRAYSVAPYNPYLSNPRGSQLHRRERVAGLLRFLCSRPRSFLLIIRTGRIVTNPL